MSERPTPVPGAADGPDAGDSRAEKRDQTDLSGGAVTRQGRENHDAGGDEAISKSGKKVRPDNALGPPNAPRGLFVGGGDDAPAQPPAPIASVPPTAALGGVLVGGGDGLTGGAADTFTLGVGVDARTVSGATGAVSASDEARRLGQAALERGDVVAARTHFERALDESPSESARPPPQQLLSLAAAPPVAPAALATLADAQTGGGFEPPVGADASTGGATAAPPETATDCYRRHIATCTASDSRAGKQRALWAKLTGRRLAEAPPISRGTGRNRKPHLEPILLRLLATAPRDVVEAVFNPPTVDWRKPTDRNVDIAVFAGDEELDAAGKRIVKWWRRWQSSSTGVRDDRDLPVDIVHHSSIDNIVKRGGGVSACGRFAARKVTEQNRDDANVRQGIPSGDGKARPRSRQAIAKADAEEKKEGEEQGARDAAAQTEFDRARQRLHAAALGDDGVELVKPSGDAAVRLAAPEGRAAAIAEASRNLIQEAKSRKAAVLARMAERRNASS